MPNKTIYVADNDLELYNRAQELAGGNLSQAISQALRRYVEVREATVEGLKEITVKVGRGTLRKQKRFVGTEIARWRHKAGEDLFETYKVYRTQKEKFAVEILRSASMKTVMKGAAMDWATHDDDFDPMEEAKETVLAIYDTLENLKQNVPAELGDLVEQRITEPQVEDLDI
ncbi:EXLDI protein [Flindersiella endophytica]